MTILLKFILQIPLIFLLLQGSKDIWGSEGILSVTFAMLALISYTTGDFLDKNDE